MKRKSIIALVLLLSMLFQCMPVTVLANETDPVTNTEDSWVITQKNYTITIIKEGFRYGFTKPDGTVMVDAHSTSGIRFGTAAGDGPYDVVSSEYKSFEDDTVTFEVTNTAGGEADVTFKLYDNYAKLVVTPTDSGSDEPEVEDNNYMLVQTESSTGGIKQLDKDMPSSYTYEADVRIDKADKSGASVGLIANHYGEMKFHLFFIKAGTVSLKRFTKTTGAADLGTKSYDIKADTWYRLKMVVDGQSIKCYVGDELVIETTDETIDTTKVGRCGVRTYTQSNHLDNVKITNAEGEVLYEEDFEELTTSAEVNEKWISVYGSNNNSLLIPELELPGYVVDTRLGGLPHTYGLGDLGARDDTALGVRDSANLLGMNKMTEEKFSNCSTYLRYVSGFLIAPDRDFAMCIFETDDKRVSLQENESILGGCHTDKLTIYYFFGETTQIYGDYKTAREAEGYYDSKPHYEMYGIGWEAYGSLGWNVYQSSVEETVQSFLDEGYKLTWAVVGSGFWQGDRKGEEGLTTSFGMWDDTYEEGRKDNLANPRFEDPDAMKEFFADRNIPLLLGLRINFQLPDEYKGVTYGGGLVPEVDGEFVYEALDNGYLMNDSRTGELFTVSGGEIAIPNGSNDNNLSALLDGHDEAAVAWYADGVDLWGVDGFKEDTMLYTSHHDDSVYNPILTELTESEERDYLMIVRNGAYSVPGDILRAHDYNYDLDHSRMVLNVGAFAASGQGNVYPDILGGTHGDLTDSDYQIWITREAWLDALCPSMSVGIPVYNMNNDEYEAVIKKAATFHSTYAPTFYNAAIKNYETGYPYAHTPIYLADPDSEISHTLYNTTDQTWEWLIDETLLAAPIFGNDYATMTSRDIYLPEGEWMDYETGVIYKAGKDGLVLEDYELPVEKTPVFVGGKGILVGEDLSKETQTDAAEDCNYFVEVFPVSTKGSVYEYTWVDGNTKSTITANMDGFDHENLVVTDLDTNEEVEFKVMDNGAIRFAYTAGHDYEVTGGKSDVMESVEVTCKEVQIGETVDPVVTVTNEDGNDVTDLTGYEVKYEVRNINVIDEELKALKAGETEIRAIVTKNGLTVKSEWVTVKVNSVGIEVTSPTYGEELTSGTVTITGTVIGVESVEAVLGEGEAKPATLAEGVFTVTYENLADGDYTLTLNGKNGETTSCTKTFKFSVDTAQKAVYDHFDGTSTATWVDPNTDESKKWKLENGILTSGGSVYYTQDKFSGTYTIETDVTLADTQNDKNTAGVIFGATDSMNFYHVRIKEAGTYEFFKFYDESGNQKNTKIENASGNLNFIVNPGTKYTLKLEVDGAKVSFYVNGNLVQEHTFSETIPEGAVGYRANGGTFTSDYFDVYNRGWINVSYKDIQGNQLAESVSLKKVVGDNYVTEAKEFPGYTLTATPGNAEGTVTNGTTEVVYTYAADGVETGTVTVTYLDSNGNELKESQVLTGEVGELYKVAEEIEGYTLIDIEGEVTGRYSNTPATVTLYYINTAAAQIIAEIDEIGTVTLDSGETLEAIRQAYDALSDIAKDEVTNYQTLLDAESDYAVLVSGENADDAEEAKEAAEAAKQAAVEAQAKAEQAEADAVTAKAAAEAAQVKAETAQAAAEQAKANAEAAKAAAELAAENAGEDAEAAEAAQAAADAAQDAAEEAQAKAEAAQSAAVNAQTAAEEAQSKAETAKANAETAKNEAENAAEAAENSNAAAAQQAAKAAESALSAVEEATKAAAEKAEAAKQANAAAGSASAAAKAAEESAGYANEAAQSASDAQAAQKAAEDAKAAAEAAQKAAEEEKAAAEAAKKAAEDAKAAAEAAQKAVEEDQMNAEAAEEAAIAAQAAAEAAKKAAEAEKLAAEEAQKAAEEDRIAAEAAQAAAEAAQKAAEEAALNIAKYQAAMDLDAAAEQVDQSEYDAAQIEALSAIVSDAKAAIAQAQSMDEVQKLLDEAKAAMGSVEDVASEKTYEDVSPDAWYYDYVEYMVEKGYMNGVSEDKFDVNGSVTRAQLVTIMYRVAGEPSVEGLDNPFTDVEDGKWYTDAIIWAASEGIVNGVTETKFAPNEKITRQQIVTILYRYSGANAVEEDHLVGYTDADKIASYAKDAMNWAIAEGVVNGATETTLAPAENATRAQICAIVMRYLES